MTALHELAVEFRAAVQKLESMDLDETTLMDTIEGFQGDLNAKIEALLMWSIELDGLAETRSDRAQALVSQATVLSKRAASIREYVKRTIEANKVATPLRLDSFVVRLAKNPQGVDVYAPTQVPEGLCRVIPAKTEPDKNAIKAALKAGQEVPGARLSEPTYRMVVE